jgi:hypothetical protein
MSRLVVLSLGQGSLQDGFTAVTVQITEADNPYRMKWTASLPASSKIPELYQRWQLIYFALSQRLRCRHNNRHNTLINIDETSDDQFEIEEAYITNVSQVDLTNLCEKLSIKLNSWLNSPKFRKIDQQLRTHLKPTDEIRFIIETNDNLLRRLPWHLWSFFEDYPFAEIAFSSAEYQATKKSSSKNQRSQPSILAILGNSKNINVNQDRAFLENLSTQSQIQFLVEPDISTLNDQLWQQGWDILFFAGHSCSKEQGLLQINQTDTITLEQLRYALKQAISRGLKLAIFNSCDGLGLAQLLQDLHIPQVIVMREPVSDFVAQAFLKYFLDEFSSGNSLYTAVRFARERLQGIETEHPCATWLPIIFQNPAEPPMFWSQPSVSMASEKPTDSLAVASTPSIIQSPIEQATFANQVLPTTVSFDSLMEMLNRDLLENQGSLLKEIEIVLLQGIWQGQIYSQIAKDKGYSPHYLTNIVAPQLCQRLSKLLNKRVNKRNCRALLEFYAAAQTAKTTYPRQNLVDLATDTEQSKLPRFPSGSVPLDSPFYIKNPVIAAQVEAEISKPGALIRIKGPREIGKTSLLLRILDHANRIGYRTVSLNLEQIDQAILSDLNRFLRWLCANIALQLQLEPRLDEYWDEDIGSKVSCSLYLRARVLEQIDSPVVLALDEVSEVFEHPQVAKDFFPLLRSWYEDTKRSPLWQKLRLIVVHSTEVYVPLQLNQSPFNVGLPIQLTGLSLEQVQQLAQFYGLDWTNGDQAQMLMDMVGGHPTLVHLALYHLCSGELTLTQLLQAAPTSSGIYYHHLQRHWANLQAESELAIALHKVMNATEPVPLEPIFAYKLGSMGLIKQFGNKAIPSCELYRQYFESNKQQPESASFRI